MLGEEGNLFGRQVVETYQEEKNSHIGLTYDGSLAIGEWRSSQIPAGRQLPKPWPLFKKLDPSVAEEEVDRLKANL